MNHVIWGITIYVALTAGFIIAVARPCICGARPWLRSRRARDRGVDVVHGRGSADRAVTPNGDVIFNTQSNTPRQYR